MPSKVITSPQNDQVKSLIRLRDRKERSETGLTLVDGLRESEMALAAGLTIKEIYSCPAYAKESAVGFLKKAKDSAIVEVDKKVFEKIAYGDRLDGILSVVRIPNTELSNVSARAQFYVVIEGVEKPGNLGAILRTCDGVGVDGVIVCDGKTDLYNPNVIRASIGTVFTVPCVMATNDDALAFLKSRMIRVFASVPEASNLYTQAKLTGPIAIVLGSEDTGLSEFWKKQADEKIRIPMNGKADSLNVSASTAVVLYEALRQRSGK